MAVTNASIRHESRDRYLTYALSVVTGRALPDVRDGLKPVQRRILYAMLNNLNLKPSSSHRKSAAVVGEVLAKFHPHGDSACYEAMVRMAQDFALRYPLVDGQGNFGSLDGDSPAAYRYTEAKLLPMALEVLGEIDEETVFFRDNFDGTVVEPEVLPSRVPNLLINGASGIAVGMATNIPPHNLHDTVKALLALSEDPELSNAKLADFIKGPDFPTGCQIINTKKELTDIYKTGRGSVRMRGEWKLEEASRGKQLIVITSIPYALNKSQLVEKIANLIIGKKVPQLTDVRDESTDVVRVVLELKSGSDPETAMAYVFKHTPLETTFAVNLTALVPAGKRGLKPELLSLKACLQYFLDFRQEVVRRRLEFEKKNLEARIHILEGLVKIFDALDEALKIVRASSGRSDAAQKLRKRFKLTEIQSFAVVDMRIYQLAKTNIVEVKKELADKKKRVSEIVVILKSEKLISEIVRRDLETVVKEFGDRRRCTIVKERDAIEVELNEADYVVREEVYAIVTKDGWLKRIRQTNELSSTRVREGDSILHAHSLSTLDSVAFFTNQGYLYLVKVADFPASSGYGSPVQKILKFRDGEKIIDSFAVLEEGGADQESLLEEEDDLLDGDTVLLLSRKGVGFGITIDTLKGIKRNGKRVMKFRSGDELAAVCHMDKNFALFSEKGYGLAIKEKEVPVRESAAVGVSLMGMREGDGIVGAISFDRSAKLIVHRSSGNEVTINTADVVKGRRGLKGNKVISRGDILGVEVA